MANVLKMATVADIVTLIQAGSSDRRISALLSLDRGTVAKYRRQLQLDKSLTLPSESVHPEDRLGVTIENPPNAPTGSVESAVALPTAVKVQSQPIAPTGAMETAAAQAGDCQPRLQNPPNAPTGSVVEYSGLPVRTIKPGPPSNCEPYRGEISRKLEQGLTAQRIWQDLIEEHGFSGRYPTVRRFVHQLKAQTPELVRRMEVLPGAEAQVDFGTGAWVVNSDGKRRRPWVLRIVLSHSRKAYSEAVYRQTTEEFIKVLENAFHYFGGVPRALVIDNLRAAVRQADWYDPEIHPRIQSFAAHYGTVFLPTRPYTPQHKGKVESGVKYVKNNALAGRTYTSLEAQCEALLDWEHRTADLRIHGTTKRQVKQQFEEVERPSLQPLPRSRFPFFHEARRKVGRDGHIEVAKAYYSMPPEYIGREVWVRWDARVIRVFDEKWRQIAIHSRTAEGQFQTDPNHIPKRRQTVIERNAKSLLNEVAAIGKAVGDWANAVIQSRGIEGVRVILGLRSLARSNSAAALNAACNTALSSGLLRLRTIRELLIRGGGETQQQFDFLDEHPVIRPLSTYAIGALYDQYKERNDEFESL